MDENKLDLSSLGPSPAGWQSTLDATMSRVDAALRESQELPDDPFVNIAAWSRPLLLAAAAALAIIVPVEIALELKESRTEVARRLAAESVSWVVAERSPTGGEILRAMSSGAPQ